ncbi:mechanosensitive ion channel family protein [Methylomicrobium sp. Wu6]|uniref:mechanosensitive ion channel family protein n=1 Tax=Methylomicrobium sp. Wu6 TaxID=3107928 RepID=UPI002DD62A75|nr:mechanosensitive ion channel family protein [Methylomicrobium sp. Wu6]MEC4748120.1 mechanosensitive ion channel family protein [Methylomicrobium sp. Wu6]
MPAVAAEESPLKPINTSSPRTTLLGFIEFMNKGYGMGGGLIQSYLDSSRLYLTPEEMVTMRGSFHYQEAAQRVLDLSEVPPAMVNESARRLAIQLKEVLDRIDLPPVNSIPDAEEMAKSEFKRWTLPNSEIRLRRVETGPRAGEYLFSAETVKRLPEFYDKVKDLPYKPDASIGWNDFSSYSPVGVAIALYRIVPSRWLIDAPRYRVRTTFLGQPLWRWGGIVAVLGSGFAVVFLCFRLSRYGARRMISAQQWLTLLRPISVVAVTPVVAFILAEILRVSGIVYQVLILSLWTLFYLAFTWAVWVAGGAVAESLSNMEKLQVGSIDSQLIRLVMRLLTVVVAICILVAGADRVGLPAYSVLAGLGVGGLAVALAAQQTLANLLGSLIIMFEKPFAVGDSIKLKDLEGTVESVGFRSTRIRTLHNSLVTIPSSQLVNSTVDNLERREYRQIKAVLSLTYDTTSGKIEVFVEGIRHLLEAYPSTRKGNIEVVLHNLGQYSLDVLLNFFVKVPDREAELVERQRILLDILRLAETTGVQFAFPTQTLHIESFPEQKAAITALSDAFPKNN